MNDTAPQWNTIVNELMALAAERKNADPATSYTAQLLQGDENTLLKKLLEEAGETALAAKDGNHAQLCAELADLWFHCFIVMSRYNVTLEEVATVLSKRRNMSGLAEKASRNNNTVSQ